MVARRNWLLRFSILINIAVLLYICSHMMIGESNMNLVPSYQVVGKISQQSVQTIVQQQQQQQDTPQALKLNANNNEQKTQETNDLTLPQYAQQPASLTDEESSNVQQIPRKDSLLQELAADDTELDSMKDSKDGINNEDSRFDMPTDSSYPPAAYQDINLVNQSINSDGGGDSLADLEMRLK